MKKTFSVVVGLFVLLILPAVSFSAAPRPYISGQLGVAFLSDSDFTEPGYYTETLDYDPGFATTFAGGANFGMFRVEGEIGYQTNEIDRVTGGGYSYNVDADLYCLSFLVNGYIDFVNTSRFTPYISAGIGIANVGVDTDYYDYYYDDDYYYRDSDYYEDDDTVFAYQVGAGVAYSINKNMILDLKYRFFATEDPNLYGSKVEFKSHNIYFGFRYTF